MNTSSERWRAQRVLAVALLALFAWAALAATGAEAQAAGTEPTAIGVAGPPNIALGETVTLQAKLVGVGGAPIPKARIDFTTNTSFLLATGDMVLAVTTTDATGMAVAQFVARQNGTLTFTAVFAGDSTYAASTGSAQVTVTGNQQLYQQQAGVLLPGLNAPPGQNQLAGVVPHWFLSGWPIAAVLLVVWSLYGTAAWFLGEIAVQAGKVADHDAWFLGEIAFDAGELVAPEEPLPRGLG
jgi:Bacterial Ig-like domain (group 3)